MPKRTKEEKIRRYRRKLRKLEQEHQKYSRIVYSSDDSDNSDNDEVVEPDPESLASVDQGDATNNESSVAADKEEAIPELDQEILSALGEATEETPKFGPNIHERLSQLWLPILLKGINGDAKEKLLKEYLIPKNCQLLQAPKLNPEISAAVADSTRGRDKRVEAVQQQLGQGIAALNKGLELLLDDDGTNRLQAIKHLSDSCRILCDLHHIETEARKKFITPGLDKGFLNIIQDVQRDDFLFGNKLSEKIKATKVIEKQGLQIKKPPPPPKAPTTPAYQTSRPRQQGNWTGPPRFPSNRGGRGGHRGRGVPVSRKIQPAASAQQKPSTQSKQPRATGQQ